MEPRLNPSVRRVTILRKDDNGAVAPVIIYERARKTKKGTSVLRPFERAARRLVKAQERGAASYLSRHERSNEKKRDGWVRDLPQNVFRASTKGTKALKLNRLLSF